MVNRHITYRAPDTNITTEGTHAATDTTRVRVPGQRRSVRRDGSASAQTADSLPDEGGEHADRSGRSGRSSRSTNASSADAVNASNVVTNTSHATAASPAAGSAVTASPANPAATSSASPVNHAAAANTASASHASSANPVPTPALLTYDISCQDFSAEIYHGNEFQIDDILESGGFEINDMHREAVRQLLLQDIVPTAERVSELVSLVKKIDYIANHLTEDAAFTAAQEIFRDSRLAQHRPSVSKELKIDTLRLMEKEFTKAVSPTPKKQEGITGQKKQEDVPGQKAKDQGEKHQKSAETEPVRLGLEHRNPEKDPGGDSAQQAVTEVKPEKERGIARQLSAEPVPFSHKQDVHIDLDTLYGILAKLEGSKRNNDNGDGISRIDDDLDGNEVYRDLDVGGKNRHGDVGSGKKNSRLPAPVIPERYVPPEKIPAEVLERACNTLSGNPEHPPLTKKEKAVIKMMLSLDIPLTRKNLDTIIAYHEKITQLETVDSDAAAIASRSNADVQTITPDALLAAVSYAKTLKTGSSAEQSITELESQIRKLFEKNHIVWDKAHIEMAKSLLKCDSGITAENITAIEQILTEVRSVLDGNSESFAALLMKNGINPGTAAIDLLRDMQKLVRKMENIQETRARTFVSGFHFDRLSENYNRQSTDALYDRSQPPSDAVLKSFEQKIAAILVRNTIEPTRENIDIGKALIQADIEITAETVSEFQVLKEKMQAVNARFEHLEQVKVQGETVSVEALDSLIDELKAAGQLIVEDHSSEDPRLQRIENLVDKISQLRVRDFYAIAALMKKELPVTLNSLTVTDNTAQEEAAYTVTQRVVGHDSAHAATQREVEHGAVHTVTPAEAVRAATQQSAAHEAAQTVTVRRMAAHNAVNETTPAITAQDTPLDSISERDLLRSVMLNNFRATAYRRQSISVSPPYTPSETSLNSAPSSSQQTNYTQAKAQESAPSGSQQSTPTPAQESAPPSQPSPTQSSQPSQENLAETLKKQDIPTDPDYIDTAKALSDNAVPITRFTVYNLYLTGSAATNIAQSTTDSNFVSASAYLYGRGIDLDNTPLLTLSSLLNASLSAMASSSMSKASTAYQQTKINREVELKKSLNLKTGTALLYNDKNSNYRPVSKAGTQQNAGFRRESDPADKAPANYSGNGNKLHPGKPQAATRQPDYKTARNQAQERADARISALKEPFNSRSGQHPADDPADITDIAGSSGRSRITGSANIYGSSRSDGSTANSPLSIAAQQAKRKESDSDIMTQSAENRRLQSGSRRPLSDTSEMLIGNRTGTDQDKPANDGSGVGIGPGQISRTDETSKNSADNAYSYAETSNRQPGPSGANSGRFAERTPDGSGGKPALPSGDESVPEHAPVMEKIFTKILSSVAQLKDISMQHLAFLLKTEVPKNMDSLAAARQVLDNTYSVSKGLETLERLISQSLFGSMPQSANALFQSLYHHPAMPGMDSFSSYYQNADAYLSADYLLAYSGENIWDSKQGRSVLNDLNNIKKLLPGTNLKSLKDGATITDINNEIRSRLYALESKIQSMGIKADDPVAKVLSSIKDNIRAQEQLNKDQVCFQIPFMYNQKPSSLTVYVFDKGRKEKGSKAEGNLSVSLNLETESLGTVDVNMTLSDKLVDLEIVVSNRTVRNYFDSIKNTLNDRVRDAGFKVGSIVCETQEQQRPSAFQSALDKQQTVGQAERGALSVSEPRTRRRVQKPQMSGVDMKI